MKNSTTRSSKIFNIDHLFESLAFSIRRKNQIYSLWLKEVPLQRALRSDMGRAFNNKIGAIGAYTINQRKKPSRSGY